MKAKEFVEAMQSCSARSVQKSPTGTITAHKSRAVGPTRGLNLDVPVSPTLQEIADALARHMRLSMSIGDVRQADRLAVIREQVVVLLQELAR